MVHIHIEVYRCLFDVVCMIVCQSSTFRADATHNPKKTQLKSGRNDPADLKPGTRRDPNPNLRIG